MIQKGRGRRQSKTDPSLELLSKLGCKHGSRFRARTSGDVGSSAVETPTIPFRRVLLFARPGPPSSATSSRGDRTMSRKHKSKRPAPVGRPESIPLLTPNAAGMDIGADEIYVAVPADRDGQPVQRFGTFTGELGRLSEWLKQCGIETVAMEATGVYWIPASQT